jgi:hypothetical protein
VSGRLNALVSLVVSACAAGPAPNPQARSTPAAPAERSHAQPSAAAPRPEEPPPRARDAEPTPTGTGLDAAPRGYPPPPIVPPYERSAQAGDGQWTPFGGARDRAGTGTPVFHKTTLHPHATSRFIELTVIAVDLASVRVRFMPGVEDVEQRKVPFLPGLVAADERDDVLAVFNGGFQPRHGRWGMRLLDVSIMPPRDIGCSIALTADGSVDIRTHSALAATATSFQALRQTPPCLLEQGVVHPDLVAGRDKLWGGRTPGIVTRRRSALGIDASRRVLFYAIGVEATPRLLAEGMRALGASEAAELDINWNWTRFLLFGEDERGELAVSTSLVAGDYAKTGYVSRPSERDFFYLVRRR